MSLLRGHNALNPALTLIEVFDWQNLRRPSFCCFLLIHLTYAGLKPTVFSVLIFMHSKFVP